MTDRVAGEAPHGWPRSLPLRQVIVGPKSTPRRKAPARHSCIVASEFVRLQIDPRIKRDWNDRGLTPKFGDLRRIWRSRHCAILNPYDSEFCPYTPEDCALAYFACASSAAASSRTNPVGYFWAAAKSMALDRADSKPLERDRAASPASRSGHSGPPAGRHQPRRHGVESEVPDAASGPQRGSDEAGLRRDDRRPVHIGSLLRGLDLGPRQGPAPDGEEGAE